MEWALTTRKRKEPAYFKWRLRKDDVRLNKMQGSLKRQLDELLGRLLKMQGESQYGFPKYGTVDNILYSRGNKMLVEEITRIAAELNSCKVADVYFDGLDTRIQGACLLREVKKFAFSNHDDVYSDDSGDDDDDMKVLRKWFYRLADCREELEAYEKEQGTSWHSVCYPLDPKYNSMKKLYKHGILLEPLHSALGPVLYGLKQGETAMGPHVDIKHFSDLSLLGKVLVTQTGETILLQPDTFGGKYVFVFCINAPVLFQSDGFQSLLNLCNELSERGDVEIIMVARMIILADKREVFDHLFSGFPKSCLAVPYEDWEQRDYIGEYIGRILSHGNNLLPRCLVFDTQGLCLKSFYANDYRGFPYGAEAFPFTKEIVEKVSDFRVRLRKERITDFLRPYVCSLDSVVHEFSATSSGPRKKSPQLIGEVVKEKHVGLYVCCQGNLIPILRDLYKQCKLRRLDFEIVVLYLPFFSGMGSDIYVEMIDGLLQDNKVSGWWCLPFNNSVSLRFWDLTKDYYIGDSQFQEELEDKLIIVGPNGKIVDMYGGCVIDMEDGIDAYPFTRASFVKNMMRRVRDVKLESLVADQYLFRGNDPSDVISAHTLLISKKKIIVFFGRLSNYRANGRSYDFQYQEMKKNGDEFEVVFIDYDNPKRARGVSRMPWYVCCPPDGTYTILAEKLKNLVKVESLFGFGEDGRICSIKQLDELDYIGNCLEETLFGDIYHNFGYDDCRVI